MPTSNPAAFSAASQSIWSSVGCGRLAFQLAHQDAAAATAAGVPELVSAGDYPVRPAACALSGCRCCAAIRGGRVKWSRSISRTL